METMSDRIRAARRAANLTQEQLGAAIGVTKSAVSHWETGNVSDIRGDLLLRAATTLGVEPEWLRNGAGPRSAVRANFADVSSAIRRVPLISWTTAGTWADVCDSYAPGDGERMVETTARVSSTAFALRCIGDSMEPTIPNGSVLIVDPNADPLPNRIVVVRQNHDAEATCKRLVRDGSKLYLKPDNPRYPILELRDDAVICGVVRQYMKDLD
jgi:SOS-response transcriptional repressor LexA